MKTCKACGESKPLDQYHKRKKAKDGRRSRCKACAKAYAAGWYARNRDEVLAHQAEYYARPEVKARKAEYHSRPEVKAHRAEYHAEYRQTNPHLWWEAEYRRRVRAYGFEPVVDHFTRAELIAKWGDACYLCGGDWDQLEHVTPVSRGGEHSLENCRPACEPCNRRAWAEYRRAETA